MMLIIKLVLILGIITAVLGFLSKVRKSGATKEKLKTTEQENRNAKVRNRVETRNDLKSDSVRDRLRNQRDKFK